MRTSLLTVAVLSTVTLIAGCDSSSGVTAGATDGGTDGAPDNGVGGAIQAKLQDILDKAIVNAPTKTPGAVLLVSTPSEQAVVASGKSNVVVDSAMSSGDMLRIASMTKTFVAAVVLKLAEEGKLDLNETVSRYVPDITARIANGQSATVRNLLNMTSGMFEYYDNPAYLSAVETRPARQAWTAEEVIAYAYDQSAYFSPGVNFKYTNTNYLLLELIVNRVSASTLAAEMRRILFMPLAMDNTFMEMKETKSGGFGGLLVRGYSTSQTPFKDITEQNDSLGLGDGGLISDAPGVAKFLRALFKQKSILNDNSLVQMKTSGFAGKDYGLGLEVKSSTTYGPNWGHGGKSAGFQSDMRYYPDKDLVVVILTNEENSDSGFIDQVTKDTLSSLYP